METPCGFPGLAERPRGAGALGSLAVAVGTAGAEVVTAPAAADTFRPPGVVVVDLLAVRPSPNVDQ